MPRPPPLLLAAATLLSGACAPPLADTETSGELRVLTYNVAGLPDGLSRADGRLLDRMPQIRALLDDYDLVGLQENFDVNAHAALTEGTRHAEVTWFSATAGPDRVYGAGLAQLLPSPTIDYLEQHYTQCHGVLDGASDCLASKGFQAASLDLGGEVLDVYNTHHEAGGGEPDLATRMLQVEELVGAVQDRSADRAALVLGDFNLHPDDAEDAEPLAVYDDAGLLRACDLVDCAEPNHIDQVRVRSGERLLLEVVDWSRETQFVNDAGVDLSDHPAIAVTVAWRLAED